MCKIRIELTDGRKMDFELYGIAAVPVIAVICFLVAEIIKAVGFDKKWLPVICGICGGILGVVARITMSSFPGTDYLSAVAIGIVSGLAATGAHQIYKQLSDKED